MTVAAEAASRSLVSETSRAMACESGEASPPIDSEKTDGSTRRPGEDSEKADESMMLPHL